MGYGTLARTTVMLLGVSGGVKMYEISQFENAAGLSAHGAVRSPGTVTNGRRRLFVDALKKTKGDKIQQQSVFSNRLIRATIRSALTSGATLALFAYARQSGQIRN